MDNITLFSELWSRDSVWQECSLISNVSKRLSGIGETWAVAEPCSIVKDGQSHSKGATLLSVYKQ